MRLDPCLDFSPKTTKGHTEALEKWFCEAFSNQITSCNFSAFSPPRSPTSLRVSAAYATAEVRTKITSKTASFYDVLGIQTGATCREIKSALRKVAIVLHPDVAADQDASAAEEFMRVHAAYATLSDPEKRAMYDNSLFWRRRRPAVTYSGIAQRGRS